MLVPMTRRGSDLRADNSKMRLMRRLRWSSRSSQQTLTDLIHGNRHDNRMPRVVVTTQHGEASSVLESLQNTAARRRNLPYSPDCVCDAPEIT